MNRLATLITLMLGLLPLLATAGNGVPKKSVILQGIDIDSMQVRLDESDLQPLEGIWYYPNEEMTLGIERYRGEHNIGYRIILLDSPDINVMPGTVIGYIAASAVDSKYQLWLYSQRDKVTLLKPLEFDLLLFFVRNQNIALTREKILTEVWGLDFYGESRTIDIHVSQLRKKTGLPIVSVPKIGYRLETAP